MAMTEQQVQLVVSAQNGDVKSFEQLYAIYYDKVYGFARMILKNESTAEDVLQETFITAWQKLNTLQTPATFFVWIQIIAKNLCNMQLRRKNIAILLDAEQDLENFEPSEFEEMLPAAYAERADLKERLGVIIDSLSEVQRQAIVLYYFNELSVDEIADVMECSANTVKTRLFLARKAIHSEVEERERKSGEKFYGVAGLPMLPLGKLIQLHMESLSIGPSAANASLSVINDSISFSSRMGTAVTAAKSRIMEDTKMATKLSLKAKVLLGIAAVAAVGAVTALVVILTSGGDKNILPYDGGSTSATSATVSGETSNPGDTSELGEVSNQGDISNPESTSEPTGSSQLIMPSDASFHGETSGASIDSWSAANNGYWCSTVYPAPSDNAVASDDKFVGFFMEGGVLKFEYGIYRTAYWIVGEVTNVEAKGDYRYEFTLHIPATPATEMDEARPERTETVFIHDFDHRMNIKIENLGTGEYYSYEYGGNTLEEAFNH